MVNLCQGAPRFIKTSAKNDFKITATDLSKHISPKTKVLIINSPSNPAGSVYSRSELEDIAKSASRRIFRDQRRDIREDHL
jgi:aspartate aminotransferase